MRGHAFVLHLPGATARLDNARALLTACGMAGEIWTAVDGTRLSESDLAATVGATLFVPPYAFALSAAEIGCFLSHRQIWAEIVRRDLDFGIILEDTAVMAPATFVQALRLAEPHIGSLGLIQFQTRPAKGPALLVDTTGPCVLKVPRVAGPRTTTQMVSRDAARHLLDLSEVFDRPVDAFLQCHWHTGLRPASLYPSGIRDSDTQRNGSTGPERVRHSLLARLGRAWARRRYDRAASRAARQSPAPAQGGLA